MKKWILFILLTVFLAACGNDDPISKKDKERINSCIEDFFQKTAYTNIQVKIEESVQADIPIEEIPEYTRMAQRRQNYVHVYEKLFPCLLTNDSTCNETREELHELLEESGLDFGCEIHDHEHTDAELLDQCAYLIQVAGNILQKITDLYTPENYIVHVTLNERAESRCTPVIFYLNRNMEIISVEFRTEEAVPCK